MCESAARTVKYEKPAPPAVVGRVRFVGLNQDGQEVAAKDASFWVIDREDRPVHAGSCGAAECEHCGGVSAPGPLPI